MKKNKKLGLTIILTATIAFSAGWVTAADHRDGRISIGLVTALGSVGENLFGDGNFGVSIVGGQPPDDNSPATEVVQIDIASGIPPDDGIPALLNVFVPPDPVMPGDSCEIVAQIGITSEGVRVHLAGLATGAIMLEQAPLSDVPPNPCNLPPGDDTGIGDNPG